MSELPMIDFAGVRARDAAATKMAAKAIHEACMGPGFFYISKHGVPDQLIDETYQQAQAFFRQPVEKKREVAINKRHRGWNALGDALMYEATKPDYKEFYSIGLELAETDRGCRRGRALARPQQLARRPAGVPQGLVGLLRGAGRLRRRSAALRRDFSRHRRELLRRQLQEAAAAHADHLLSAASPAGRPGSVWSGPAYRFRLHHAALAGRQRRPAGAGAFEQRWIPAPPIPGTLVINVADLLQRWSNDRYVSTPHRVLNASGRERFSIATFYDPDFKAVIDPADLGVRARRLPPRADHFGRAYPRPHRAIVRLPQDVAEDAGLRRR